VRFSVPSNLSVIGTMNTADKSLAVFDLALRRRFEFDEIEPDSSQCSDNYGGLNIQEILRRWNTRIAALLSRDYRLGHSELMETKLEHIRVERDFPDNNNGRSQALAMCVRRKVLPLLLEYFHDDWRKAEAVLGNRSLLQTVSFDDVEPLAV